MKGEIIDWGSQGTSRYTRDGVPVSEADALAYAAAGAARDLRHAEAAARRTIHDARVRAACWLLEWLWS